jgi:predicted SAM-dependent methyltransferase
LPVISRRLRHVPEWLLSQEQSAFIADARSYRITYGDATRGLSLPDRSCGVVYVLHVLEHLDSVSVGLFLGEVHRILAPGGSCVWQFLIFSSLSIPAMTMLMPMSSLAS